MEKGAGKMSKDNETNEIEDKKTNEKENKVEEKATEEKKSKEKEKKQPFVPLEKQSKFSKKEFHASQRGSWGNLNPVTKKPPNPKAYNRRKTGR